jgi:hypothetical protein
MAEKLLYTLPFTESINKTGLTDTNNNEWKMQISISHTF